MDNIHGWYFAKGPLYTGNDEAIGVISFRSDGEIWGIARLDGEESAYLWTDTSRYYRNGNRITIIITVIEPCKGKITEVEEYADVHPDKIVWCRDKRGTVTLTPIPGKPFGGVVPPKEPDLVDDLKLITELDVVLTSGPHPPREPDVLPPEPPVEARTRGSGTKNFLYVISLRHTAQTADGDTHVDCLVGLDFASAHVLMAFMSRGDDVPWEERLNELKNHININHIIWADGPVDIIKEVFPLIVYFKDIGEVPGWNINKGGADLLFNAYEEEFKKFWSGYGVLTTAELVKAVDEWGAHFQQFFAGKEYIV
jgi:hypothetical protein